MSEVDPFNTHSEVIQNTEVMHTSEVTQLETAKNLKQIVWEQFKEHKAAVIGAYTILIFIIIALSAPLISLVLGVDPTSQNVFNRYKPPFSSVKANSSTREQSIDSFIKNNPDDAALIKSQLLEKKIVSPV